MFYPHTNLHVSSRLIMKSSSGMTAYSCFLVHPGQGTHRSQVTRDSQVPCPFPARDHSGNTLSFLRSVGTVVEVVVTIGRG